MEATQSMKPETNLDPMKLYATCQECGSLLEWEAMTLTENGKSTCDPCIDKAS